MARSAARQGAHRGLGDLAAAPGYPCRMTGLDQPGEAVPDAAREAILAWYAATGRELAFRATADPYAVLVSELMAQQTQAERAADAWTRWMARWPTVRDLAAAPVAEAVRAWAGLGYNRRAVALHRAAQEIVREHGGEVPSSVEALERLPGVGPYTARAVAAIAFGMPVGAVDVNVRRVLGRLAAGGPEAFTPASMQALADAAVPPGDAAAWTHAVMDLGARLCKPSKPRCADCPAYAWCRYAAGERPSVAREGSQPTGRHRPSPPFESTNRWLRGRVLERARSVPDGAWAGYRDAIGDHGVGAVREAVLSLGADGLLDVREGDRGLEARLPR
jgi:A/G-specific adenine glycosylase